MTLSLIAFTRVGGALLERLAVLLCDGGYTIVDTLLLRRDSDLPMPSLHDWTERAWASEGLIFIGATGIAVRAIAPFVRDKLTDPAVVSIDEQGRFAVPLLGGHIGGANALACALAGYLGAVPVISTATDINGKCAIDLWAAQRGLVLCEREHAKAISAALLDGTAVGFHSDFSDVPPAGFFRADAGALGVSVSLAKKQPFVRTLHAVPRVITLGVGCRRGVSAAVFERVLCEILAENHLVPEAVAGIATIDIKQDEPCIRAFCEKYQLPLAVFSAAQLACVPGTFTPSAFVYKTTGVDNVCERAAVLAADAPLRFPKTARDAVTVAGSGGYDGCGSYDGCG